MRSCFFLTKDESFVFFNRGDTTYHGTTPDKGVWPSPYTVAGVIVSPTRLYYDFAPGFEPLTLGLQSQRSTSTPTLKVHLKILIMNSSDTFFPQSRIPNLRFFNEYRKVGSVNARY
jgi:hypothetical protein